MFHDDDGGLQTYTEFFLANDEDGGLLEFETEVLQEAELGEVLQEAELGEVKEGSIPLGKISRRLQELLEHFKIVIKSPTFTYEPIVKWANIGRVLDNRWLTDDIVNGMIQLSCLETNTAALMISSFFMSQLSREDTEELVKTRCKKYYRGVARVIAHEAREKRDPPNVPEECVFYCPQHVSECHWTLFIVDLRKQKRYYYDPLGKTLSYHF